MRACIAATAFLIALTTTPAVAQAVAVPFKGCEQDGQTGPIAAPPDSVRALNVAPDLAERLAFYGTNAGYGVLAPRGWTCFGTYGSNGTTIYIAPEPLNAKKLLDYKFPGFTGPAIQLTLINGDTSGRFSAARIAARLFPDQKDFVQRVIAEGIDSQNDYVFEPWPADRLVRRGAKLVEYETPANAEGAGTYSRLLKADAPIIGFVAIASPTPDIARLTVRLPKHMADLSPIIVAEMEKRYKPD